MKYLAFDIEAANGYKAYSICSIGIVIADEQFNIEEKYNIWINPKCKYNLNGTRENVGINLNLDKNVIDNAPDFFQVYERVKELLTDKDTIVMGHAVDSDVIMLNAACEHNRLPSIDFNYICTQLLFKCYKQEKEVRALHKIADEIGVTFNAHQSDDDALVSMLTLKYLVETTQLTLSQLMDTYKIRKGDNSDFVHNRVVSLAGQVSKKSITRQVLEQLVALKNQLEVENKSQANGGKFYAISRDIEISNTQKTMELIRAIYNGGGRYTTKVSKSNFYIYDADNEVSNTEKARYKYLQQLLDKGSKIKLIELPKICKKLGVVLE